MLHVADLFVINKVVLKIFAKVRKITERTQGFDNQFDDMRNVMKTVQCGLHSIINRSTFHG